MWLDRTPASKRPRYPSLRGNTIVDVVIIGGGLTGAALAWKLSAAGIRVAVLESEGVGRGSTAANSALLMHEPDKDLGELTDRYGSRAARRIWQLALEATRDFIQTVRKLDIRCDLVERDAIYYALQQSEAAELREEHRRRRAAGFGGRWLDARALRRMTGIAGAGGIYSSGNAKLDPYQACIGLLRAAEAQGATIFERSKVGRIKNKSTGVEVTTGGGSVFADYAIIATGYSTRLFKPLERRFAMKHTYVLATERIGRSARKRLGLDDVLLWDTERPYHYARWTKDGRLLLGGADRRRVPEHRRAAAFTRGRHELREYFERVLPSLRETPIAYAWEGLFALTPDGLPYIGVHRRYPRHLFALGYGGNGMTFAFLAARLLLGWLQGTDSSDLRLFAFGRHRQRHLKSD